MQGHQLFPVRPFTPLVSLRPLAVAVLSFLSSSVPPSQFNQPLSTAVQQFSRRVFEKHLKCEIFWLDQRWSLWNNLHFWNLETKMAACVRHYWLENGKAAAVN